MLLRHAWLAPLLKPPTISEEDEEQANEAAGADSSSPTVVDREIAGWVKSAMERRKSGAMGKKAKPALHAAPLDAVPSPSLDSAGTS